jgi:ABC-type transport system involved in multi-copper enzyme maturation permease subunit
VNQAPEPGRGGGLARDAWVVAAQEWSDSLRSRRAMVILLLFLLGAVAGTLMSIRFIHSVEKGLAGVMQLEAGTGTGGTTTALWKSRVFRDAVSNMVDDKELAESLLDQPPLSLFYCVIAFFFTPMLVTLTAAPRLAEEVWSGSVRFVLFRTSRPAWCLGKFAGQALLLLAALLASVPAAWLCGLLRMTDYPALDTLVSMTRFAVKAWIYGLAYLGLASGVSLLFRSPGLATAAGLIALMGVSAAYHLSVHFAAPGWRRALDLVTPLTPRAHYYDLLRPGLAEAGAASLFLLLLGLGSLACGYARFARRDL